MPDGSTVPADPTQPSGEQRVAGLKRAVRVDLAAIQRGALHPGDICDLGGTDPLTLDAVQHLLPGSRLHAVTLDDDGAIVAIARLGKRPTRHGAWAWLQGGPPPTGPLLPTTGVEIIIGIPTHLIPPPGTTDGSFLAAVARLARAVPDLASTTRNFGPHQATALAWAQPVCQVAGCNRTAVLQNDHRVDWAIDPVSDLPNADRLCVHHHRLKTHHGYRLEPGTGPRRLLPPDPDEPP